MKMRSFLLALVLIALSCSVGHPSSPSCRQDSECSGGTVCFIDGCGDPGQGLLVEVFPDARLGQFPEDFALGATLSQGTQDLTLSGSASIDGPVGQNGSFDSSPVSVALNGRSAIIPGLLRHFETTVFPVAGNYHLPIASGIYSLYATPSSPAVPPLTYDNQQLNAGGHLILPLIFASSNSLYKISGQLTRAGVALSADVEIQALDPFTLKPLSRKGVALASSGSKFTVFTGPEVATQNSVLIRTSPKDTSVLVPSKDFLVSPSAGMPYSLEMGDFGDAVDVSGHLISLAGAPVSGALVYSVGIAAGEGKFTSPVVETGKDGRFTFKTLPGKTGSPLTFYAIPPLPSNSAILSMPLPLSASTDLGNLIAPDKACVTGRVRLPPNQGTAAVGVVVNAKIPRVSSQGALTAQTFQTITDSEGKYAFYLEPADYQFDFTPSIELPQISRFFSITGSRPLPEVELSNGRTLTGIVAAPDPVSGKIQPSPFASVLYFRLGTFDSKGVAYLLAQTLSDANGRYSVVLPAR